MAVVYNTKLGARSAAFLLITYLHSTESYELSWFLEVADCLLIKLPQVLGPRTSMINLCLLLALSKYNI